MSSVPTCLFSMFSVSDWKQQVGVFHTCASSQYVQQQEQGWSLRLPHPQVVLDTRQRASSGKLLLGGCETFHVLRGNIKAADTSESSESSGLSLMRQCNGKQASPCRSPPGPWASSPQTGFPPRRTETPGSLSGWTEGWRTALDSSPPDAGPSGGDRGTPRVPGWKSGRGRRPESLNSRNQLTPNHVTNLTQLLHHQEMLKFSVYEVFTNSSILQEWGWQDEGNAKFPAPLRGGTRSSLTWFWLRLISMACSSETSEGTFWILLRDKSSRSRCLKAPSLGGNSDNWFPDRLRVRKALSWPTSEGSCWMWFPFRLRVSSFFSLQISGGRHAEDTQTDTPGREPAPVPHSDLNKDGRHIYR